MAIRRLFFDWKRPALALAAGYLWEQYARGDVWNLDRVVVALPGGRAGRRLLERMVELAGERGANLTPPRIVTVGHLPELLYEVKKPLADDLAQELAWIEAIKRSPRHEIERLVKAPPAADDLAGWLSLAHMLSRLHTELAADRLNFAGVERKGSELAGFDEAHRWQALHGIQDRYLNILDGLELWDKQSARLWAIDHRECRTDRDIILVGTVDMDGSARAMLDQVADRVTSLIFAPAERQNDFDEHGCLLVERWREMPVAVEREQIAVVDGPADQADAALRALAEWNEELAADEVTLGAANESVVPYLEQRLAEAGLVARFGAGRPLARSGPVQLLELVADYLEFGQFGQLAALARHPDLSHWLVDEGTPADCLTALDRFYRDQLPASIDHDRPGRNHEHRVALAVSGQIRKLLEPLSGNAKPKSAKASSTAGRLSTEPPAQKPLSAWAEPIATLLATVYGNRQLDRAVEADRAVLEICNSTKACLESLAGVPDAIAPKTDAARVLRLLVERLASSRLPPPTEAGAVEVLGWLELPLDDARGAIITGMNEGFVPTSGRTDLFLPDRLRGELGVEDNDRRYARDNYALNLLAASRRLRLIAGRRGPQNDPLIPSRLLFACEGDEMAHRARAFFTPPAEQPAALDLAEGLRAGQKKTGFVIPQPKPLADPVASLRVTELRDYLACPYRYYLRHRLDLEALADAAEELAANDFGSLLHDVLKDFAGSPMADSTDPATIHSGLGEILDRVLAEKFGSGVLPAVRLQAEQIRGRLKAFAAWQAQWRRQGWRIHVAEFKILAEQDVRVPGAEETGICLVGRIDRIDVHEKSGKTIVFDYKTGDHATTPDKAHRKQDEWIDLQLPMYRHLVRGEIDRPVQLGYIILPKDAGKVCEHLADWSDDLLATADTKASEVLRAIRAQTFWPPTDDGDRTRWFPEFAAICQEDLLLFESADGDDNGEEELA